MTSVEYVQLEKIDMKMTAESERVLQTAWMNEPDLWHMIKYEPPRFDDTIISLHIEYFCPEVTNLEYHLFASELRNFPIIGLNEAYRDYIQSRKEKCEEMGISKHHWLWQYENIIPLHYSDCTLYSILKQREDSGNVIIIRSGEVDSTGASLEGLEMISGFRRVKRTSDGEIFDFNDRQSKIVEALYKAPNNTLHVRTILHDELKLELEKYSMYQNFRNHETWQDLIQKNPTKRGYWKLIL